MINLHCEFTKSGKTILSFDGACSCFKDVTQQTNASLSKLLKYQANYTSGVPLSVKLFFYQRAVHWELGPYADGTYSFILTGQPFEVKSKGEILWPKNEIIQFKLRQISLDGRIAVSPLLEYKPNEQEELNWKGVSTLEQLTCE